jgi:hypothetical protein
MKRVWLFYHHGHAGIGIVLCLRDRFFFLSLSHIFGAAAKKKSGKDKPQDEVVLNLSH